MRIHILGICGTLMGSIALLARAQGHEITGSDENVYPPMSDHLEAAGIELCSPYDPADIPADVDLVIVGNANLARGNACVEYILEKRIPFTSGAEWLGKYLLKDKWVIAIAGTHGKTTTTSMVSWILEYANLNPGFLIGGVPGNFPESARLTDSPFFVIEADEYDTSYFDRRSKFLHYYPRTLVMNNLEFDHADIFADLRAIEDQFHLLLRTVPGLGRVIYPEVDAALARVLARGCWSEMEPLGTDKTYIQLIAPDASEFEVFVDGESQGIVRWATSGTHNAANGLAAIMAARHVGVPVKSSIEALCQFQGVKRRMEVIHEDADVTIYDDFAHHPTAIATTLAGLRNKVGDQPILAIIEPGSHTMRKGTHAETLADSASIADEVIWARPQDLHWDMSEALARPNYSLVDNNADILNKAEAFIADHPNCHIVIMSNRSFGGLHKQLVAKRTAS